LPADRDDVPGPQLRSPPRFHPPVDQYLLGLQQRLRVCPVLGEAGELEELAQPNGVLGDRDIEDRWSRHPPIIAQVAKIDSTRSGISASGATVERAAAPRP
jgi:hypothetical protein